MTRHLLERAAGQVPVGGLGSVIGIDLPAWQAIARALGADPDAVTPALLAIERGLVEGLAERGEDDSSR